MVYKQTIFSKTNDVGDSIRPWIVAGPFHFDYSDSIKDRSFFEEAHRSAGRNEMEEIETYTKKFVQENINNPTEGDNIEYMGKSDKWRFLRTPEKLFSFGKYFFSNHLGTVFANTTFICDEKADRKFSISSRNATRMFVIVNDALIFNNANLEQQNDFSFEGYDFIMPLEKGENRITIVSMRIDRNVEIGFRLECTDSKINARCSLLKPVEERQQVEDSLNGTRVNLESFYQGQMVKLIMPPINSEAYYVKVKYFCLDNGIKKTLDCKKGGKIEIGNNLPIGKYKIYIDWYFANGQHVTSESYDFNIATPKADYIGYNNIDDRKRMILENLSRKTYQLGEDGNKADISTATAFACNAALYSLNRADEMDEKVIKYACEYIDNRYDASNFVMQSILRIMFEDRRKPKLKKEIYELLKKTILNFKYWVDEPGPSPMWFRTENHRMTFHICELLAGMLFPNDIFPNSGQNGMYHVLKGRMLLVEWLNHRLKYGIHEWLSDTYYPVMLASLVNAYDYISSEEVYLVSAVKQILNFMMFSFASNSYEGVFGTAHSKTYGDSFKYSALQGSSAINWMMFGAGEWVNLYTFPMFLIASSSYKPPEYIYNMAWDYTPTEIEYRQYTTNLKVYRTPHYMMSSAQDYNKGIIGPLMHAAQVTMKNNIKITWTCPLSLFEGSGVRPDYWAGNLVNPRIIQKENVMSIIWKDGIDKNAWMSHCYFEVERFEEVRIEKQWFFARQDGGYIAIYSKNPAYISTTGKFANREIICNQSDNIWLVELSSCDDEDSFDSFVDNILNVEIQEIDGGIKYNSPSGGLWTIGWDIEPQIDGESALPNENYMVRSKWLVSEYGSGKYDYFYDGNRHTKMIPL